ncbi:hypothetical protein ABI59_00925 [Acidobacteria bacterium Mor1]|nr:hypothetical protein ABI59_00925 [Acidobacteria bacterium Mor1]
MTAIAGFVCLAALTSTSAGQPETVGDFLLRIAHVKHLSADNAAMAEQALRDSGHAIPQLALDQVLLEKDVVAISKALGLNLSTRTPQDRFTRAEIERFVTVFGDHLTGKARVGAAVDTLGAPADDVRIRVRRAPKAVLADPS